jgi:hypothetical protein
MFRYPVPELVTTPPEAMETEDSTLTIVAAPRSERWRSWLTHYATDQKVAGSIPDGVIGIFH